MRIWIRSQDKTELINCNRVQADRCGIYTFAGDDFIVLGVYPNSERATEVLNEIQDRIKNIELLKAAPTLVTNIKRLDADYLVYEMPEE